MTSYRSWKMKTVTAMETTERRRRRRRRSKKDDDNTDKDERPGVVAVTRN